LGSSTLAGGAASTTRVLKPPWASARPSGSPPCPAADQNIDMPQGTILCLNCVQKSDFA
jgi:hypothetical protein